MKGKISARYLALGQLIHSSNLGVSDPLLRFLGDLGNDLIVFGFRCILKHFELFEGFIERGNIEVIVEGDMSCQEVLVSLGYE